ncbi:MAG: murein L,D-transpeptidase [Pedosphaera sp.]|nr:murein L,D-transpeptidase [Pedosphaera sp.]
MSRASKNRSPARRRQSRGKGWLLVVLFGLLGLVWLAWDHGWISRSQPLAIPAPPSMRPTVAFTSAPPIVVRSNIDSRPIRLAPNLVREVVPTNLVIPGLSTNRIQPLTSASPLATNTAVLAHAAGSRSSGRPVRSTVEAQIALGRLGISCGSIDGSLGSQTRAALRAFQARQGLEMTGELDDATRSQLTLDGEASNVLILTGSDLAGLRPVPATWLGKSEVSELGYATALELVAEKSHSHPSLIRQMNPEIDWAAVPAEQIVRVPDVEYVGPRAKAARLRISLSQKTLRAFDGHGNLLAHFPCSIASRVEKRPVGELHVEVVIKDPNYTFNPEIFPESAEARALDHKLVIPPGPNNPVGVAWIGLDRPGYGIHGTPRPEDVGRTESHGCFRLANWNADYLRQIVTVGTPVMVEE